MQQCLFISLSTLVNDCLIFFITLVKQFSSATYEKSGVEVVVAWWHKDMTINATHTLTFYLDTQKRVYNQTEYGARIYYLNRPTQLEICVK